jgi:DNA-directed RNA polymerase subunit RPC12/RpoP
MNMKARKSLSKQQPQTQIDIKDTEMVKCDDCGNASFIQAFFLRRLSALMSPTGQEALIPIQIYSCGNCGKVPDKLKQDAEG